MRVVSDEEGGKQELVSLWISAARRLGYMPWLGTKWMAETLIVSGTAGGGVWMTTWWDGGGGAAIHSLRCRGQSCKNERKTRAAKRRGHRQHSEPFMVTLNNARARI